MKFAIDKIGKCLKWLGLIAGLGVLLGLIFVLTIIVKLSLPHRSTQLKSETKDAQVPRFVASVTKENSTEASHPQPQKPKLEFKSPIQDSSLKPVPKAIEKSGNDKTRKIIHLLTDRVDPIELCPVDCQGLPNTLQRLSEYNKGIFSIENSPKDDPAFQLAKLVNQAAFGPTGRKLFILFDQVVQDPMSFKSIGILKFLWSLEDIRSDFEGRGKTRAGEADALVKLLKSVANSCEKSEWDKECHRIETEIAMWIEEGALQ